MTETCPSGIWIVKPAEEGAFVKGWTALVKWAGEMPRSGTFRPVRDPDYLVVEV